MLLWQGSRTALSKCTRAGEPEDFRVAHTFPLPKRIADGLAALLKTSASCQYTGTVISFLSNLN